MAGVTPAERELHAVVGAGLPDPPDVPQARVDLDLDDGDVLDGLVIWTPGHPGQHRSPARRARDPVHR